MLKAQKVCLKCGRIFESPAYHMLSRFGKGTRIGACPCGGDMSWKDTVEDGCMEVRDVEEKLISDSYCASYLS